MADELFELKNYFYLGNLASAVTEGETVHVDDDGTRQELELIMARIEYAQGKYEVLSKKLSSGSPPPAMGVLKKMCDLQVGTLSVDDFRSGLQEAVKDSVSQSSKHFLTMCAVAFASIGDFDDALRAAHQSLSLSATRSLEDLSVQVQVLIEMDRLDVADKHVEKMQAIDEDHTLTQLCTAWCHLTAGTADRAQEALYIFQDLLERHGATDAILNGMATCYIAAGKSDDAERTLSEALTKNPNCASSLVNVICSSSHRNKPSELVSRYFSQLSTVAPNTPWLIQYKEKETEFDSLAQQMAV